MNFTGLVVTLMFGAAAITAPTADRRVVDVAVAGNPESEAGHGYVGYEVTTGLADGRPFKQARGWMRFALTTFDDTEVTIACTFVSGDSVPRRYDVVVEDSVIATRVFTAPHAASAIVEFQVPLAITKGRTNIAVVIRARDGLTPRLRELRTIQDHNEVDPSNILSGVTR